MVIPAGTGWRLFRRARDHRSFISAAHNCATSCGVPSCYTTLAFGMSVLCLNLEQKEQPRRRDKGDVDPPTPAAPMLERAG